MPALHPEDLTARHYRPHGGTTVCGAMRRAAAAFEAGETPDPHLILKVPATTDIRKVECPRCRVWVRLEAAKLGT